MHKNPFESRFIMTSWKDAVALKDVSAIFKLFHKNMEKYY